MDTGSQSNKSDQNINDKPNGGFPPLYLCDKAELEKENLSKREFTIKKQLISIKDILKMRKTLK